MSTACIPCAPPETCVEGLDAYNLQDDVYPDLPFCMQPPCGRMPFIFVSCCDGSVTRIENPDGDVYQPGIKRQIDNALKECDRKRAFCPNPPPIPDCPNPPCTVPHYFSAPASCTIYCPDGTPFTYTVNSGLFIADTQSQADALAKQWVCDHAPEHIFCIPGTIVGCACLNAPLSISLASSPSKPLKFLIVGGTLPQGLSIPIGVVQNGVFRIQGTPTFPGNYLFIIRAVDSDNNFIDKTYSLNVVGITNTSLPAFTIGTPYSAQLHAAGGSGSYIFGVQSGTFPDGLGMDAAGLITGTPTNLATDSTIVFEVVDTSCQETNPRMFIPRASMTTVAVTIRPTVLGYLPFIQSVPPKKYKQVDFSGEAYQSIYDGNDVVRYSEYDEFTGTGLIDIHGVQLSRYHKNVQGRIGDVLQPWYSRGDLAGNSSSDNTGFPGSDAFYGTTPDAFHRNVFSGPGTGDYAILDPHYPAGSPLIGTLPINWNNYIASPNSFPPEAASIYPTLPNVLVNGIQSKWILYTVRMDYHVVVSDEYTDAEALSVAVPTLSTSNISRNEPRKTGYTSRYVTVTYTISLTNLVVGQVYNVVVPLHGDNGTSSSILHTFTAVATIHSITGTAPTPAPWVAVEVRPPLVTFA